MPTQTSQMEGVVQAMISSQRLTPRSGMNWWRWWLSYQVPYLASIRVTPYYPDRAGNGQVSERKL